MDIYMNGNEQRQIELILSLKYGSMVNAYNHFSTMPGPGEKLPSQDEYDVLMKYANKHKLSPILFIESKLHFKH